MIRFMLYDGVLNVDRFLAFLRRLIKDAGRNRFLIVDDLAVRHARKVESRVVSHAHEIEPFYLSAHAPEHNPDEHLNNEPKQKLRQRPQPGDNDDPVRNVRLVLRAFRRPLNVRYGLGRLVRGSRSRARRPGHGTFRAARPSGPRSDNGLGSKLAGTAEAHLGARVRLWRENEARIGQKGRTCHRWYKRGVRPPGPADKRFESLTCSAPPGPARTRPSHSPCSRRPRRA